MPELTLDPLPMIEALAFWKAKVPMARADWDELVEAMKARAFMVTGLTRLDEITRIKESIYQALAEGETFAQWKARVKDIIQAQNWSGVRLQVIYRTNVQSAYLTGLYSQLQKTKRTRPYWMYDAVNDTRTRPAHRAMDGKIFPADHPFWDTWYPPNGYRCRCGVRALSEREMKREGLEVETEDPTGKLFEPVDLRTGSKMPARLLMPDPGFKGNIGKDWLSGLSPSEIDAQVEALKLGALCKGGGPVFAEGICKPPIAEVDRRHVWEVAKADLMKAGLTPAVYAAAFLKEFGLGPDESKIFMLPGDIPVVVSKGFFIDKATGEWKQTWADKGPYVRVLARTIQDPFEIWMAPVRLPSGDTASLRLIRMFAVEGTDIGGYCVFHLIAGKWWSATAFAPKAGRSQDAIYRYIDSIRDGVLIYREV